MLLVFEDCLRRSLKTCDAEECIMEVAEPDIRRAELLSQHTVHILAMFRGIREAARVTQPWGLLESGCDRSGRRGGFDDGAVGSIPRVALKRGIIRSNSKSSELTAELSFRRSFRRVPRAVPDGS